MRVKLILVMCVVALSTSLALSQGSTPASLGSTDVSFGQDGCVKIAGASMPTKIGKTVSSAYLEFKSDLPAGSHIELWQSASSSSEAPWTEGGELLDTWVITTRTGSLVKLSLEPWIDSGASATLYLREGAAGVEDSSDLEAKNVSEVKIKARFR